MQTVQRCQLFFALSLDNLSLIPFPKRMTVDCSISSNLIWYENCKNKLATTFIPLYVLLERTQLWISRQKYIYQKPINVHLNIKLKMSTYFILNSFCIILYSSSLVILFGNVVTAVSSIFIWSENSRQKVKPKMAEIVYLYYFPFYCFCVSLSIVIPF